ncbi:MAG: penicillin-binding protein 2 [Rhodospirillaceae bacterium]|nr:MAG: penicillin-binding protein 2 [Rhodospirillaceae bacterium]
MYREGGRYRVFSRRAAMLAGGKLVLASALVGRLYYLQVIESDRYVTLAEENRINLRLIQPSRGSIVDRHGTPMARNRENYRVVVIPEQTLDIRAVLDRIGLIVPIGATEIRRVLHEMKRKRSFVPVTVRENLSWEEVARLEVNAPDLPGVLIDVGQSRYYPLGAAAAHVIGYVAAVTEKELTEDPLLQLPDFRIGKSGIEKNYDLALRGKAGSSQMEVNSVGRVVRELSREEGKSGYQVALTLDSGVQAFAGKRFGELSGAAVAMNVYTGEVLLMVSTPGFDPNEFVTGLSEKNWQKLLSNRRAPLTNKCIAGQYAPGSTYKMIVATAALEAGLVTPEKKVFCKGYIELGGDRFHCWKRKGHGHVGLHEAIQKSCDVYFYEIARRCGINRISEMARRFGLGQTLIEDLAGEQRGLVPDPDWKRATFGAAWQGGETLITGIGQGYVLATPLQLAVMISRMVNGGDEVFPHLTKEAVLPEGIGVRPKENFKSLGIRQATLAHIRSAMAAVINVPGGTAYGARIRSAKMAMGGKTGTSQVRRISERERKEGVRKNKNRPWRERDHALFVGFAPVNAPKYAVSVIVEHGGSGSSAAAPIARDILREIQRRDVPKAARAKGTPESWVAS